MKLVTKVRAQLQGRKTYLVAFVLIVLAVMQWAGIQVPGCTEIDPLRTLLEGLGLGSLRAAISKVE